MTLRSDSHDRKVLYLSKIYILAKCVHKLQIVDFNAIKIDFCINLDFPNVPSKCHFKQILSNIKSFSIPRSCPVLAIDNTILRITALLTSWRKLKVLTWRVFLTSSFLWHNTFAAWWFKFFYIHKDSTVAYHSV